MMTSWNDHCACVKTPCDKWPGCKPRLTSVGRKMLQARLERPTDPEPNQVTVPGYVIVRVMREARHAA